MAQLWRQISRTETQRSLLSGLAPEFLRESGGFRRHLPHMDIRTRTPDDWRPTQLWRPVVLALVLLAAMFLLWARDLPPRVDADPAGGQSRLDIDRD